MSGLGVSQKGRWVMPSTGQTTDKAVPVWVGELRKRSKTVERFGAGNGA